MLEEISVEMGEEIKEVKKLRKSKNAVEDTQKTDVVADFDESTYFEDKYFDANLDNTGGGGNKEEKGQVVKKVFKANYGSELIRCKIRTAARYNVPLAHLEEAANILNNRKIDNIVINDLIGRSGFFDKKCMNRADLARKSGVTLQSLEMADEKLKTILKSKDVLEAYTKVTSLKLNDSKQSIIESIAFGG